MLSIHLILQCVSILNYADDIYAINAGNASLFVTIELTNALMVWPTQNSVSFGLVFVKKPRL